MRKKTRLGLSTIFAVAVVLLTMSACQKQIAAEIPKNNVREKINQWLDQQIALSTSQTKSNVQSLKENLDLTKLSTEIYHDNVQFVVIPVKEEFKVLHQMTPNSVNNLLLTIDNVGNIQNGKFVKFEPSSDNIRELPKNTFTKIFTGKKPAITGIFKFLNLAGRLKYKMGFNADKTSFFGNLSSKNIQDNAARVTECTDWYYILYYYDEYGNEVDVTQDYIGTTCNDCQNGMYESLCPDGSSGGGGDPGEDCSDAQSNLHASSVNEYGGSTLISNSASSRTKSYSWTFFKQSWGIWSFTSYETGIQVYNPNVTQNNWQFQSLTHNSEARSGFVIGGSVSCNMGSAIATVGLYNAIMELHYSIQCDVACQGSPISVSDLYTSNHLFTIND